MNRTLEIGLLPSGILGEQLNQRQLDQEMRRGGHFNLNQVLLHHPNHPFFIDAADIEVLAIINGPRKALWYMDDTAPGTRQIALTSHDNSYMQFIRSRDLTPVISSIHDLPRILREKRFRYIELGYIDWFYQDQSYRNSLSLIPGSERTERYLLLVNSKSLQALPLTQQKVIEEYAQLFASHAANLIVQTEQEILTSLSDAEHHSHSN